MCTHEGRKTCVRCLHIFFLHLLVVQGQGSRGANLHVRHLHFGVCKWDATLAFKGPDLVVRGGPWLFLKLKYIIVLSLVIYSSFQVFRV